MSFIAAMICAHIVRLAVEAHYLTLVKAGVKLTIKKADAFTF